MRVMQFFYLNILKYGKRESRFMFYNSLLVRHSAKNVENYILYDSEQISGVFGREIFRNPSLLCTLVDNNEIP